MTQRSISSRFRPEWQQRQQPDGVFVGGPVAAGGDAPAAAPFCAVMHGEDDIGVAGIDASSMASAPPHGDSTRRRGWRAGSPSSRPAAGCHPRPRPAKPPRHGRAAQRRSRSPSAGAEAPRQAARTGAKPCAACTAPPSRAGGRAAERRRPSGGPAPCRAQAVGRSGSAGACGQIDADAERRARQPPVRRSALSARMPAALRAVRAAGRSAISAAARAAPGRCSAAASASATPASKDDCGRLAGRRRRGAAAGGGRDCRAARPRRGRGGPARRSARAPGSARPSASPASAGAQPGVGAGSAACLEPPAGAIGRRPAALTPAAPRPPPGPRASIGAGQGTNSAVNRPVPAITSEAGRRRRSSAPDRRVEIHHLDDAQVVVGGDHAGQHADDAPASRSRACTAARKT